jgi:hypothetical protein
MAERPFFAGQSPKELIVIFTSFNTGASPLEKVAISGFNGKRRQSEAAGETNQKIAVSIN